MIISCTLLDLKKYPQRHPFTKPQLKKCRTITHEAIGHSKVLNTIDQKQRLQGLKPRKKYRSAEIFGDNSDDDDSDCAESYFF